MVGDGQPSEKDGDSQTSLNYNHFVVELDRSETLVIQEFIEAVLRNFIAYEQFSPEVDYYFTSYASVMDMLIDSKADVGKLVESKVIVNNLGSNKDVATVINGICVNIEIERFCYSEVIQKLDKYYESYWPKHFANFKRMYFENPWAVNA